MTFKKYNFIVVGGGPCGCSLATRLAKSPGKPEVLLIEAGGKNEDPAGHAAGQRNTYWATGGLKVDYGYKSTPQAALNDRELPYHRGKCLGGSTATNIGVWDYGSVPEMNEWARLVGDDAWKWENVQAGYKDMETYHNFTPKEYAKYVSSRPGSHGSSGPVNVTHPEKWDPCLPLVFEAIESHRCIGMGVSPATVRDGKRETAASAYLQEPPENLQIVTDLKVERVIFDGTRAHAVEVAGGDRYHASKEVILCAGAIDTPKLLLLSGIGASEDLIHHGIPIVLDQPNIGKELKDHPVIRTGALVKNEVLKVQPLPPKSEDIAAAAQGYLRVDPKKLSTLSSLDEDVQSLLMNDRTATHELLLRIVPSPQEQGRHLFIGVQVLTNCQSLGRVSLRSKDPHDPPLIELNLLSHPYDRELAVEVVRSIMPLLLESSVIPTEGITMGPNSGEEKEILEYIKSTASHLWHAAGTVKMGKSKAEGTCVTPDFKLEGLQNIRVADLSVAPIIPSNHIQSTGYLIGNMAADKIIAEHGLGV